MNALIGWYKYRMADPRLPRDMQKQYAEIVRELEAAEKRAAAQAVAPVLKSVTNV